jgi:L-ascorbate metabolism protein UlaG (beta-lactamase superfamily)
MEAIDKIKQEKTLMVFTEACQQTDKYKGPAGIMKNGDKKELLGIEIEAVPAYNINNKRPDGNPFHPKGEGNGYILTFDHTRIYIAGDTENIPEMENIKNIDIAFLPMNLPYTMTPEMVADAALKFKPKILYPYHYGNTEVTKLNEILAGSKIELRIRDMK